MKICFISGPYQPQRCGISDYIDLLISEFSKINIECVHTIINQKNPLSKVANNLPDADIYSIQFAPYAYSPTGLSGNRLIALAKFLSLQKVHVNLHEIWIGTYSKASLKERLTGWLQKKEILRFLKIIKPKSITSSNAASLDRLQKSGVEAKYLYLFGNIPHTQTNDLCTAPSIRIAVFGTLYEKFPYSLLAEQLNRISFSLNKPIEIRIIGRQRDRSGFSQICRCSEVFQFVVSETGELPSESISMEIQSCDLGICTTPYDVIGKSGATSAMLERGLPIIAFDDGDTQKENLFIFESFSDQICLLNDDKFIDRILAIMQKKRKPFFDGVAHTTDQMLKLIS